MNTSFKYGEGSLSYIWNTTLHRSKTLAPDSKWGLWHLCSQLLNGLPEWRDLKECGTIQWKSSTWVQEWFKSTKNSPRYHCLCNGELQNNLFSPNIGRSSTFIAAHWWVIKWLGANWSQWLHFDAKSAFKCSSTTICRYWIFCHFWPLTFESTTLRVRNARGRSMSTQCALD